MPSFCAISEFNSKVSLSCNVEIKFVLCIKISLYDILLEESGISISGTSGFLVF